MYNLTTRAIMNEINGDMYEGDTLEFLESFVAYCNDRTTFGVPNFCCPFDSDMTLEFGTLTVLVSDIAMETGFSDVCFYIVYETNVKHTVCVTPYVYDEAFNDIYPSVDVSPTFNVSDPHDLEKLCRYIDVTFAPSFFE